MQIDKQTKFLNLFNLTVNFTEGELKEAYRDLAHVWHPDKHHHNERLRKKAENQLKEINEGFEYLKQILGKGNTTTTSSHTKSQSGSSAEPDSQSQNSKPGNKTNYKKEESRTQKSDQTQKKSDSSSSGCLIALIIGGLFFVFLMSQGDNSNLSSESSSYSSYQTEREVSKKLDEKNGFKQFQFRISVSDAEKIHQPTNKIDISNIENTVLLYENNGNMNIGDYPVDTVELSFFKDMLYRIDIKFSSYQSEIYQTFSHAFGQPYRNDSWTRGDLSLRANSWEGDVISCTILAEKNSLEETGWYAIVLYDKELYLQASEYKENEPVRASKDIHNDGLGSIHLRMDIKDFIKLFKPTPRVIDSDFEQKNVFIRETETIKIGYYSIDNIKGFFFKNKLYRIDINFSDQKEELFKAFISRFPNSSKNNSWSQGKQNLTAMEFRDVDNVALILAPKSMEPQWESLIFYSIEITQDKDKFEREAPKRAANDI